MTPCSLRPSSQHCEIAPCEDERTKGKGRKVERRRGERREGEGQGGEEGEGGEEKGVGRGKDRTENTWLQWFAYWSSQCHSRLMTVTCDVTHKIAWT